MIICEGIDLQAKEFKSVRRKFTLKEVASATEATVLLNDADVFLIGPGIENPAKEVQKIYAADKHIAVIVLVLPIQAKQVKQAIQFSPFVGKNTLVVILNPELNLAAVCENAASRTRQKRNFFKLNINKEAISAPREKVKLAQMGTFLEYAPIGAILFNDTDRIVNFNQQAKKLFPTLVFLDVELSSLFANTEAEAIREFIHDGHDPQTCKEIHLQQRVLEVTSTQVYNEEGIKHFLVLFNDVTNQRLESQRIQSILDALPQMAWTTDTQGAVTYLTQAWYFYSGQTTEEALGSGWSSVIFPGDKDRLINQWNSSIKTGSPFQQAARYKNTKGEYRWHLARASAIRDKIGQVTMWVGTFTDIHDQILLTEELERKVKERTHSLEVSNSELEQFAHVSSHDLQEPLRKIRTFAEMLKDNVYQDLDDGSKRYLDKISATAERMTASLRALLNFTSLRREEKFVSVDLNEIVSKVLIDLELMISQKDASVKVSTLPVIKAVPIQMQQLFYNLINNALKFSRNEIAPLIEISARQLMEEELVRFPQLQHFKE
ncbi:MAG TPA: PAS domain S-box protein, partial [Flavisolibacter sp.]|nr:PAS domain S-box protein [Flavisolibacter sp.]